MRSQIVGTGSYAPAKVLTNADLERMVETNDEWIVERTGIRERHVAATDEATSDMALEASRRALEMAGMSADEIDLIVVGTVTPDMPWPSVAALLQGRLGNSRAFAFDVSAGCAGSLYALSIADQYVARGSSKCWMNLERYGNTSSASVPTTLDEANRARRLRPSDTILMMAVGAGMAWGAGVLQW